MLNSFEKKHLKFGFLLTYSYLCSQISFFERFNLKLITKTIKYETNRKNKESWAFYASVLCPCDAFANKSVGTGEHHLLSH